MWREERGIEILSWYVVVQRPVKKSGEWILRMVEVSRIQGTMAQDSAHWSSKLANRNNGMMDVRIHPVIGKAPAETWTNVSLFFVRRVSRNIQRLC